MTYTPKFSSPLEENSRYVILTEATVNRLIDARLTAAQYRAVLYFSFVDPFGNRFVETGGPMARQRLGISKSTYYEALAALEREELFEFGDVSLKVRNRIGSKSPEKLSGKTKVRNPKPESEISDRSPRNRTQIREIELKSEISENQPLQASYIKVFKSSQYDSLDTDIDQKRERKEREKENQNHNFEIEPDYREWLLAKASRLPEPPAMRELWLEKQSVNPANLREYEAWQSVQQQIDPLPPPLPPEQSDPADEDIAARLQRYQKQWAVIPMRKGIQNAIATHPEWNIDIGPDGPRWQPTPPEQDSEEQPQPEPDASTVLHRIKNAIATQYPITPQLQAEANRYCIDIPKLRAEWERTTNPPASADGHMRQAG